MKPTPPGWPRISSAVYYDDPARAIDWLCRAFGFEVRIKVEGPDGRIEHSEIELGGGIVMVAHGAKAGDTDRPYRRSPSVIGGANTQSMMVYVDDADAHCRVARDAGAKIVVEPKTTDYGAEYWSDRSYQAQDLEGHHWWFAQRMRTGGGAA